jgi:holo-[acyl-carrier protein] synthase
VHVYDGPMSVGIDLLEIERMERALERHPRLAERVFTAAEREYAAAKARPGRHLAARFAAKEAVLKLIGTADGVDPREVEITHEDGRPVVRLSGLAATLAEEAGVGPIDVSLSHSGDHALAVAVALTQPGDEPA